MDPREQLLQSLLDELRGFRLPERYDEAKKAKIMSNRKGQADIDKGRDDIRQNEQLYQQAIEQRRELQSKIGTLQTEVETAKQRGVETSGTQAAIDRKAAYDKEAGSALGIATEIGASAAAPLAGIGVGQLMGSGINKAMDASQTRKNATLERAAQNRVAGLTTREGTRTGAQLAGVMPASSVTGRVIGRVAPHTVLGLSVAGKGALLMNQGNDDDPFYSQMANRGLGLGMIGAGSGIAERGVRYANAPGVPPSADAISVIESNQLRRNNTPDTPETPPPNPNTVTALRAEAKAAGIKGGYKMNKTQLNAALAGIKQVTNKLPMLAAPLAAGTIAASMTPTRAEAADGTGGGQDVGEMATNAAGAGAAAAGTGYGINRLAKAVGPVARNALGVAGSMMGPMMAADAYDPDAEKLAMDRNQAARTFPSFLRGGAVEDAYQMAQVPERNPQQPGAAPPQNALSAAGQQKDPFGTALDEFMAFVQQEMAEQQQGAQQ